VSSVLYIILCFCDFSFGHCVVLSIELRLLIITLVSFGHCVVCPTEGELMCSERVSIYCSTSDIRYDIFCIDVLQFAVTVHVSFHSLDHTVWPNELGPFGPRGI
jgi:hypothetical protein